MWMRTGRTTATVRWGLAAVMVWAGGAGSPARAGAPDHPMIEEAAPAFDLEEVGGARLSLADLRGRFIVLHFGASW